MSLEHVLKLALFEEIATLMIRYQQSVGYNGSKHHNYMQKDVNWSLQL
jgi:hypothetical protein